MADFFQTIASAGIISWGKQIVADGEMLPSGIGATQAGRYLFAAQQLTHQGRYPMSNEIGEEELVKEIRKAAVVGGTLLEQVPDIPDGQPFAQEWQTFKREVCRLLKEGHVGKFAAYKGDRLLGIWDTLQEAIWHGYEQAGNEECLVQEIQLYVRPTPWGSRRRCRG